jgi:outer membrane lipoprotein LolB
MMKKAFGCAALLMLLLLNSCATTRPDTESHLPATQGTPAELHLLHMQQLAGIEHFFLQARIGIQANGKGSSGTTRWRHTAHGDDISMLSPVGGTVAKIITRPEGVTLMTNDGKTLHAEDAESLIEQHLGWRLPLTGLPDWALGRPARTLAEKVEWDSIGRITSLTQNGWVIEYLEYMEIAGYRLPKKINLQNKHLTLKLLIDRWDELEKNVPQANSISAKN